MQKWALCSDVHFPRHDKRYVNIFLEFVAKWKPDHIDLVGDVDDADATSRWSEGTVEEVTSPIVEETKLVKEFLETLKNLAPDAERHLHDGNHGWTRHNNYIKTKAKALDGLITPDMLYGLENTGTFWHSYQEPPVKRLGNFYVHHGSSISKHSADSVKKDIDDWDVSLIRGHSHRQGVYKKTTIRGRLEGYEIGHLCDEKQMDYSQFFNWQPGFAYGYEDKGEVFMNLVPIINNKAIIEGKIFKG